MDSGNDIANDSTSTNSIPRTATSTEAATRPTAAVTTTTTTTPKAMTTAAHAMVLVRTMVEPASQLASWPGLLAWLGLAWAGLGSAWPRPAET